jgi:hypothetical protein
MGEASGGGGPATQGGGGGGEGGEGGARTGQVDTHRINIYNP